MSDNNSQKFQLTNNDKRLIHFIKTHRGYKNEYLNYAHEQLEDDDAESDLDSFLKLLLLANYGNKQQAIHIACHFNGYRKLFEKELRDGKSGQIMAEAAKGVDEYAAWMKKFYGLDGEEAERDKNGQMIFDWPGKKHPRVKNMKELKDRLSRANIEWHAAKDRKGRVAIMPSYKIVEGMMYYMDFCLPVADLTDQKTISRMPLYYYNPETHLYITDSKTLENLIQTLSPETINSKALLDIQRAIRVRTADSNVKQLTWAKDHNLVAVNNGVFDTKTKKFRPFKDSDVFTTKVHTDYDPKANKEPKLGPDDWGPVKFLQSISVNENGVYDPKKFKLLLQMFFNAADHCCWRRKMINIVAKGKTGKSTLLTLLKEMLGSGSYSEVTFDQFDDDNAMLQCLGVNCNLGDDYEPSYRLRSDKNFKNAVSDGPLALKALYHDKFYSALHIFNVQCGNNPVQFKSHDQADYDRLIIVHLTKRFVGKDDNSDVIDKYVKNPGVRKYMLWYVLNHCQDEPYEITEENTKYLNEIEGEQDDFESFKDNVLPRVSSSIMSTDYAFMLYKVSSIVSGFHEKQLATKGLFLRKMKDYVPNWKYVKKEQTFEDGKGWDEEDDTALFNTYNVQQSGSRMFDYNPKDEVTGRTFYTIFERVNRDYKAPVGEQQLKETYASISRYANKLLPKGVSLSSDDIASILAQKTDKLNSQAKKNADFADKAWQGSKLEDNDVETTITKLINTCEDAKKHQPSVDKVNKQRLDWLAENNNPTNDKLQSGWRIICPWMTRDMYYTDHDGEKHEIHDFEKAARALAKLYESDQGFPEPIIKPTQYKNLFLVKDIYIEWALEGTDPSSFIDKDNTKKSNVKASGSLTNLQRQVMQQTKDITAAPTKQQKKMLQDGWQLVNDIVKPSGLELSGNLKVYNLAGLIRFNDWAEEHAQDKAGACFIKPVDKTGNMYWLSYKRYTDALKHYEMAKNLNSTGQYQKTDTQF